MSPDEFFQFFDEQVNVLPKPRLIETIQQWFNVQAGKNYGSIEDNKKMASGITKRLGELGYGVVPASVNLNIQPIVARLRCSTKKKGSSTGTFVLETAGLHRKQYNSSSTVPAVVLAPLPKDERRRI